MVKNSGTLSYVGDGKALLGTFVGAYLVRLLVADQLRVSSLRTSIAEVAHVCIGRGEYSHVREHVEAGPTLNIKILDSWMSGTHAQLDKENGKWVLTDCSSKNGTYLNGEHTEKAILCDGDLIQTGNSTFLFRDKVERSHLEPADIDSSALHQRHQAMQQSGGE